MQRPHPLTMKNTMYDIFAVATLNGADHFKGRLFLIVLIACLFAIQTAGCLATGNYGVLRTDPEVNKEFKHNRAFENHRYYYYGWIGAPDAVIGIQNDYTLLSNLWKAVDLDRISLQVLKDRMLNRDPTNFDGAILKDGAGNRMGVWFSDASGATIKMAGDKQIEFIRPLPRPIERDDDPFRRPMGFGL